MARMQPVSRWDIFPCRKRKLAESGRCLAFPARLVWSIPARGKERRLKHSAAWKQAAQILLPSEDIAIGGPITPLHGGHVGLLCTARLLNGVFGQSGERHIARWRSVKHVNEFEEEDGDTKIIRRREKWSNELRLLYITVKVMKLTESALKEGNSDGKCAFEDGPA
jgi:hypothetical protein